MKENKAFKDFRKALNESEYSEVLTGYGNRSAHKDDAGLHHLQSAGALAGINAMLATIGKGTYLDPNEAFLKMKVRLNVVQLDFPWKPGSWDGGVGSFDIPVVQFGRVDGYDAKTGEIRFDGKANPTGGYTELNLHVDVELTPESLYVVSAKLSPSVPVAEEVEVAEEWKSLKKTKADLNAIRASGKKVSVQHGEGDTLYRVSKAKKAVKEEAEVTEDYQTPAREKEMQRKIQAQDDRADRAYTTKMQSPSEKVAARANKRLNKAERKVNALLARDYKEYRSPRTYGRGGKLVKRGSRAEVKENFEQMDDLEEALTPARQAVIDRERKKASETMNRASTPTPERNKAYARGSRVNYLELKGLAKKSDKQGSDYQVNKREHAKWRKTEKSMKEETQQLDEVSPPDMEHMTGSKHTKASFAKQYGKRGKEVMYATAWKLHNKKKKEVKEEAEQIDEAGQAKLERLGKAYDKARLGARGVLNPERKKELGNAYFSMRDKVLDKRKKRIEKGTFDKEKEVQARVAHNKKNYGKGVFGHVFGKKTVKEELIGGQKKLDMNKNKRLDAQDFALLRAKKKKPVTEAKLKQWTPRLDKLMKNRDAVHSKPKKSILTQKVQDGKKVGSPRPIAKYEGK